jgi:hypothetical protein
MESANNTPINPPTIQWDESEKAVVLYCSDKLWEYLQGIKEQGIDNLSMFEIAKIYKEIKSLSIQK